MTNEQKNRFCEILISELTIVGRDVWSNDQLSDTEVANNLKWLNEINHQVIGCHKNDDYPQDILIKSIKLKAEQASELPSLLENALKRISVQ